MNQRLRKLEARLRLAERSIALIDRCRPVNSGVEARRLEAQWRAGEPQNPAWIYAYPPDLGQLRSELCSVATTLESGDELDGLYAARARELEFEARLAEAIGSPRFRSLARERYDDGVRSEQVRRQALGWAQLRLKAAVAEEYRSCDQSSERSLLSQMLAAVARLNLPIAVVLKEDLQSVAAAGDGLVFVKPHVLLTRREARRIVLHELLGHVLPRLNARSSRLGLARVGSASAADDEEGRALLIERRFGALSHERQIDLGHRHLAALSVREGADWVETLRLLLGYGAELTKAIRISSRVHRGGGLAREVMYLPSMMRVQDALVERPELEAWMASGRLGIHAARVLSRLRPELLRYVPAVGSALELYE